LVNKAVLFRLNPYAKVLRRQELIRQVQNKKKEKKTKSVAGEAFLNTLFAP